MALKRVVDVGFWTDDVVAEKYSAEDRYFMLYLLTNPHTKQCGIYHLPIRMIAMEMGHSQDSIKAVIERFEVKFKNIIYNRETQEIAILNFLKHSIIKGGKPVNDCIKKELTLIKDISLIIKVYNHLLPYFNKQIALKETEETQSMYVGVKNVFNDFFNVNEIKIDNDNENERIVPRIVKDNSISKVEEYFNTLWDLYPVKKGKEQAKITFEHKFRGMNEENQKDKANKIYILLKEHLNEWDSNNTERQYIPYFSSWLNLEIPNSKHFKGRSKI